MATRMDVLDVLRGVAIFGILIYNIGALSAFTYRRRFAPL